MQHKAGADAIRMDEGWLGTLGHSGKVISFENPAQKGRDEELEVMESGQCPRDRESCILHLPCWFWVTSSGSFVLAFIPFAVAKLYFMVRHEPQLTCFVI